jgi:hypothetical protein
MQLCNVHALPGTVRSGLGFGPWPRPGFDVLCPSFGASGNEPGWGRPSRLDYRLTRNYRGDSGQFAGAGGQRQVVVPQVAVPSIGDQSAVFLPMAEEEGTFVRR